MGHSMGSMLKNATHSRLMEKLIDLDPLAQRRKKFLIIVSVN